MPRAVDGMTAKQNNDNNSDIRVSVGVLQSQMNDIKKQTDRIETKIDNWTSVSPADFVAFRIEVEKELLNKADKATVDLLKKIVFTACGIILAAVLYAALGSIGIKHP
jgi:hypothetical protein